MHGWLEVLVLPWVIVIGSTGLYLNHQRLVAGLFDRGTYDEAQFDAWPAPRPMTVAAARALAETLYPDQAFSLAEDTVYHGRQAATFRADHIQMIVALKTGHYWIRTDLRRVTHAPDGTVLETKTYWETIFKRLHERGWLSSRFGSWFADVTAAAMVVFGLTGIVLFLVPRIRRRHHRRRMRAAGTP